MVESIYISLANPVITPIRSGTARANIYLNLTTKFKGSPQMRRNPTTENHEKNKPIGNSPNIQKIVFPTRSSAPMGMASSAVSVG